MNLSQLISICSEQLNDCPNARKFKGYKTVYQSVSRFCNTHPPNINTIYTTSFLIDYEKYLLNHGLKFNTISYYMTILRSLYNEAIRMKRIDVTPNLFNCVFTGYATTEKRAVSTTVIALLLSADLSDSPKLEACRDYFLLSFFLQGMPFIDLIYLKKDDIKHEYISYNRCKTKGIIVVGLHDFTRDLLSKHMAKTDPYNPYALPELTLDGPESLKEYDSILHQQNRLLKKLAKRLGIKENLTTHVARHSYATIAHHNNVDLSTVSQALGHHSEKVTRIYLEAFGHERLTQANLIVLAAVFAASPKGKNSPTGGLSIKKNMGYSVKYASQKIAKIAPTTRTFEELFDKRKNVRLFKGGGHSLCKLT